jgi:hypothetical protein
MWTLIIATLGLRRTIEYGAAIVVLLGLVGFGLYERHKLILEGEQIANERVEKANAAAQAKAKEGQDDVANCYDAGGTWLRDRGVCDTTGTGK